jgi:hypothetical protein
VIGGWDEDVGGDGVLAMTQDGLYVFLVGGEVVELQFCCFLLYFTC